MRTGRRREASRWRHNIEQLPTHCLRRFSPSQYCENIELPLCSSVSRTSMLLQVFPPFANFANISVLCNFLFLFTLFFVIFSQVLLSFFSYKNVFIDFF